MRERELELIAALVEGRLEDEADARALIESSPEARAEYEAQRRAHAALTGLGPVAMTESERSALHRDLWTALRTGAAASRPDAAPWYARWLPATAAVVFLLATVGVIGVMGGGQGGDFNEIAADSERATTTAAEETAGRDGDAGGDMAPLDAPTSTAGAAGFEGGAVSPEAIQFLSAEAARIRATVRPASTTGDDSTEQIDLEACLREAGLEDHVIVDTVVPEGVESEMAESVIAAVPEAVDIEEATVTFVGQVSCQVVYIDE